MTNQVNQYERHMAIQEAYQIHDSDEYFKARPQLECGDRRKVFYAGHIRGYQAATQASEIEINSLKQRVEELDNKLDSFYKMLYMVFENKQPIDNLYEAWHRLPACELMAVIGSAIQEIQWYQQENPKLQADNERLRESLGNCKLELEMQGCNESYADENSQFSYNMVLEALSSTPTQSLAEHDNKVIERCKNIVADDALAITFQSMGAYRSAIIKQIGELKAEHD